MKKTIGIIGCGNIGSIFVEKFLDFCNLVVFDKDEKKLEKVKKSVKIANSNTELVKSSDVVIIAVKPQDFSLLLKEIKDFVGSKLIVSVAAAVTIEQIKKILESENIIRVMLNLAIRINKGVIFLSKSKKVSKEDFSFVKKLFSILGTVLIIDEQLMDAATAIAGSGPGFIYHFAEGKSKSQIRQFVKQEFIPTVLKVSKCLGFKRNQALKIAQATAYGSLKLLDTIKLPPHILKNQVASKGGTTEAGLKILEASKSLEEAFLAAFRRAKELSGALWKE